MATQHQAAAGPDTLITIKISVNDETAKRLKVQLRDLSQQQLFSKLRQVLDIKPQQQMVVERYSDSAAGYITLDEANPQVFKTLIRAAKAKLKLRLKVTVAPLNDEPAQEKKAIVDPAPPVQPPKAVDVNTVSDPSTFQAAPMRRSMASDGRSVGSGIFLWREAREARASQQTLVNDDASISRPFTATQQPFFNDLMLASETRKPELAFRTHTPAAPVATHGVPWSVYCNACDKAMINAHLHCSICDDGDYDLCEECVANGLSCPGEGHWLIKRFIQDGKVVNSTTERIQPSKAKVSTLSTKAEPEVQKEMPGTYTDETKTLAEEPGLATRTCNNCVIVLAEREFVTCTVCDDFDLCIKCHTEDKHGHHPAHGFQPATEETVLPLAAATKLAPGRNVRHDAICDGCEKKIYGVRHKCMNCPDWDYCNTCIKEARTTHPRHRFAALFEPLPDVCQFNVTHAGIYCDGPLCHGKSKHYIRGIRYKCTICHDTDFCASCEALPGNPHNRTHPLIKLKTPVRNVNISTESEDVRGNVRVMGDRSAQSPIPHTTVTAPTQIQTQPEPVSTATPEQNVAVAKPTEDKESNPVVHKPIDIPTKKFVQSAIPPPEITTAMLTANFVRDSVQDGQIFEPETRFTQIWTMKNMGPYTWPAGCSVRFVGGDNMLNVDNHHPAAVSAINHAIESNVIGREVGVGEEVAFKVTLKAPKREGRSISYWRLKAADGTPFGHRLWCDIEVKKSGPETSDVYPAMESTATAQLAAIRRQATLLQQSMQKTSASQTHSAAPAPTNAYPNVQPHTFAAFRPPVTRACLPSMPQLYGRPQQFSPTNSPDQLHTAYDASTMAGRFASMREQQKQRRDRLVDQMQAQREHSSMVAGNSTVPTGNPLTATADLPVKQLRLGNQHTLDASQKTESNAADNNEKVKNIVESVSKTDNFGDVPEKPEANPEGSQMVFPKLEKESPESSTYESFTSHSDKSKAAYVENESGEVEQSATAIVVAAPGITASTRNGDDDFESVEDELEVLSATGDDSDDDDSFVTDEEYDILDASDSETLN